jgi:hypothetical protein
MERTKEFVWSTEQAEKIVDSGILTDYIMRLDSDIKDFTADSHFYSDILSGPTLEALEVLLTARLAFAQKVSMKSERIGAGTMSWNFNLAHAGRQRDILFDLRTIVTKRLAYVRMQRAKGILGKFEANSESVEMMFSGDEMRKVDTFELTKKDSTSKTEVLCKSDIKCGPVIIKHLFAFLEKKLGRGSVSSPVTIYEKEVSSKDLKVMVVASISIDRVEELVNEFVTQSAPKKSTTGRNPYLDDDKRYSSSN